MVYTKNSLMSELHDDADDLAFSEVPLAAVPTDPLPPSDPAPAPASRFSLRYYRGLFDVSTGDVIRRIRAAANPADDAFLDGLPRAELYGPVWVTATVAFASFALGTVDQWLARRGSAAYRFASLGWAALLLCALAFGCPLVLAYASRGAAPSAAKLVTLFGYSHVHLIGSGFAAVVLRHRAIRLIAVAGFAFAGSVSLFRKLRAGGQLSRQHCFASAIAVAAVHIAVYFVCFS